MSQAASIESSATEPAVTEGDLAAPAAQALDRGLEQLLREQNADGHWCAELEGDSILESEYLLLKWILGHESDPRIPQIAAYLRSLQRADGAWVQYPGAAPDISATVKGYFALKLCGDDPDEAHMQRARAVVHEHGGAEHANSFSKFYLAALGQIPYDAVPSIPPEIFFLPRSFYFSMSKVSAWTRTMIAPLSIVTSHRPVRELPAELGIDELYLDETARRSVRPAPEADTFWQRFFVGVDRALKVLDDVGTTPWREAALKRMEAWLLRHTEGSDGLGAIFPPMVYLLIALRVRGYGDDHPKVVEAWRQLDELMLEDPESGAIRIQPCLSPVWDSGIAAYTIAEAGHDAHSEPGRRAAAWLVAKECRTAGDWIDNARRDVEPSGWFFEYHNPFYPDVDDTAMVTMALKRIGGEEALAAERRGIDWILALQNPDGGWAAFDRTRNRPLLEEVPFADHNAIQDPSCADITGRVLESLGRHGYGTDHPAVSAGMRFLRATQSPEGAWFGRWGVNYVYGTWQALGGLALVGADMTADWIRRAGAWLKAVQKSDGAFGESADSYIDPDLKGHGPATANQTAWGTMALMFVYGAEDAAVRRGINWLVRTQTPEGLWKEPWFTGTGFPRVFYLRYHLYPLYFPVMCLARWRNATG